MLPHCCLCLSPAIFFFLLFEYLTFALKFLKVDSILVMNNASLPYDVAALIGILFIYDSWPCGISNIFIIVGV